MQEADLSAAGRIDLLGERFEENYSQKNADGRREIYREALRGAQGDCADLRMAKALAAFLEQKEICLKEYDLFAGHLQYYHYEDSIPMSMNEFDARDRPRTLFEVEREIENYFQFAGEVHGEAETRKRRKELELLREFSHARDNLMFSRWNSGHIICDYDRLVSLGLPCLIENAAAAAGRQQDPERKDSGKAMLLSLTALQKYIIRNAEEADRLSEKAGGSDGSGGGGEFRVTLERISASCRRVASGKPACLFDALQLFVLALDVMLCENTSGAMSIGRFDWFMYPYYEADIQAGRLCEDEAAVLVNAVWLKIASLKQSYQNLTLGGCDENGKFAGNAITLLAMRASRKIARDQPLLSFRCQPDMPDEFWREIMLLVKSGLGFPALFNDKCVFKAKINSGVDPKDVWRYAIVGCVEPSISGDEYAKTEQLRVNWAKVLEVMINPRNRGNLAPGKAVNLAFIKSFEDLYEWYKQELAHFTRLGMESCDLLDTSYGRAWPAPFLSALTHDCPAKGQDITRGALHYSFSSVNGTGMADAVDSLLAVKEIVFEQRRMSLEDFIEIVNGDFAGHETLREEILAKPWRYGNDDKRSNEMMRDLTGFFVDTVSGRTNIYGNKFQAGLYSVTHHASMGAETGPLPSGRKGGAALANGISPCQGVDVNGPTAVMRAAAEIDHGRLGNGLVLDLKFTPQFLEKQSHVDKLRQLIAAYFDMGCMEVQFNVVKRETLLAAQKNPEKYRNLIVRVSGFSAYFVNLDKVLQDEIIARTEYERRV